VYVSTVQVSGTNGKDCRKHEQKIKLYKDSLRSYAHNKTLSQDKHYNYRHMPNALLKSIRQKNITGTSPTEFIHFMRFVRRV